MKQKQINQNWKEFELGKLFILKYGSSLPSKKRIHGKFNVYGSNGIVGSHDKPLTSSETIIVGRKGSIGKINFSEGPCFPIDTAYYIDETLLLVDFKLLTYALNMLHLDKLNKSAAVPGLNRNDVYLKKILLPILADGTPDLKKQKQIVAILEKAEGLKDKRKGLDELFDEYLKSVFWEMFLKEDFEIKELESVCNIIMGQSPSGDSYNENGKGIPFFQGKKEFGEKYTTNKKYTTKPTKLAKKNNILMSVRAPVGSVNFTSCDCCIGRGLCSFEPHNDLLNDYLYYYFKLNEDKIAGMGTGSTFKAITGKQIRSLKIPVPPIALQEKFSSIVEQVEKIKDKLKDEKKDADELFNALMQKAFSGELI